MEIIATFNGCHLHCLLNKMSNWASDNQNVSVISTSIYEKNKVWYGVVVYKESFRCQKQ